MTLQLTLVVLLWAVGLGALGVWAQVWRRGQLARRPALWLAAWAAALYAFGYSLEISGDSLAWIRFAVTVEYLGIAAIPTLILWLAADYDRDGWLGGRWWRWVAAAVSIATFVVVATNPLHDLYHARPRFAASGPFPMVVFDRGWWYWGFQAYTAVAILLANVVFLRAWRSAGAHRRAQVRLLFVASLVPWLGNLVNVSGVLPWAIDIMPFVLVVAIALFYLGVMRQGLAELAPVARDVVFEQQGDAALVLDDEGRVLDQNVAALRLLGPLSERHGGEGGPLADRFPDLGELIHAVPSEPPTHEEMMYGTLRDEPPEMRRGDRTYSVRAQPLWSRGRNAIGHVMVLRDITRYARMEELLRTLATSDELTAIPNRRHFLDLAEREVARARRHGRSLGMIVFDLDRFKDVNDTFGHHAGDAVLRAVAKAVEAQVRSSDMIGRLGGEEFAVVLPESTMDDVAYVAERVRSAIAELAVPIGRVGVRVSASVGGCSLQANELREVGELLMRADHAQYQAKGAGGNRVVLYDVATPVPVAAGATGVGR
ncbi:MAG: diguanylate cyclase [Trueperaceae bacterium]|nr:diguanylate cyclase [Trueperaceae bacterium]